MTVEEFRKAVEKDREIEKSTPRPDPYDWTEEFGEEIEKHPIFNPIQLTLRKNMVES